MFDKRRLVEKIVGNLIKVYGLHLKEGHVSRVIKELTNLELSQENLYIVAKNLLDIGESYFFRDPEIWEDISKTLSEGKNYTALSLGCSEGEEVYTFKFIASECFSNLEITGIDASEIRIEKAKEGTYSKWKLRKLSDEKIHRYFHTIGNLYKVKDVYKEKTEFFADNIMNIHFPFKYDFILARRVFIYLSSSSLKSVLTKIHDALKDDGYLILGKGEVYTEILALFEPYKFNNSIFWRKKSEGTSEKLLGLVDAALSENRSNHLELIKKFINKKLYNEALNIIELAENSGFNSSDLVKYHVITLVYLNKLEEAKRILKSGLMRFPESKDLLKLEKVII